MQFLTFISQDVANKMGREKPRSNFAGSFKNVLNASSTVHCYSKRSFLTFVARGAVLASAQKVVGLIGQ